MIGKIVLMLVDDDRDDRFFFKLAVEEMGPSYAYIQSENSLSALAMLRASDDLPDFIFLDLNMVPMNGRECLKELKKDEKLKNIPVIIYSTSDYEKDIQITRELGAAFYLTKSSDIFKLPEILLQAIIKAGEFTRKLNKQAAKIEIPA